MLQVYLIFKDDYIDEKTKSEFIKGVKYRITHQDLNAYYVGKTKIMKMKEGLLFEVGDIYWN